MGNRTDQRRKVKYPYNRRRSTGCRKQLRCYHLPVCSIWVDVDSVLTVQSTSEGVAGIIDSQVSVECWGVIQNAEIMVSAEATSAEQRMMLPFPLRVLCAIALASRSIWKIRPLNFSTDQRPLESMSRSKVPADATLETAPCSATL